MLSLAMLSQSCSFCKLPPTVASPRNSLSLQNANNRYAVRTCVSRRRPCHRIQSFLGQGSPLGKGIADVQNAIKRAFESASEGMKSITSRLPWKPKLIMDGGGGGGSTWGSGGIGDGRGGNTYTLYDEDEEPDWHAFFTIVAFVSLYILMLYRDSVRRYIRKHKRRFRRWRRRKLRALENKIVSYNSKSDDIISGYAIDDEADKEVFEYGMED